MSTNCMVRPYRPSMFNFIFILLVPWHEGAFNLFGYPFIDEGCYFCCCCLFLVVWSSYIILINSKPRLVQQKPTGELDITVLGEICAEVIKCMPLLSIHKNVLLQIRRESNKFHRGALLYCLPFLAELNIILFSIL